MEKEGIAAVFDADGNRHLSSDEFIKLARKLIDSERLLRIANCSAPYAEVRIYSPNELRSGFERVRSTFLADFRQGIETPTQAQFEGLSAYSRAQALTANQCTADTSFADRVGASISLTLSRLELATAHDFNSVRRLFSR